MSHAGISLAFGGRAIVTCVHGRQKRQVTTERQIAELGATVGQVYDPRVHKIHNCACCDNRFVDLTDFPRYCSACLPMPVHPLGGPLAAPKGVVDE